jgi:hypothetical protein
VSHCWLGLPVMDAFSIVVVVVIIIILTASTPSPTTTLIIHPSPPCAPRGQRDSELLLSFLTVPYLRVPLVASFFAAEDRIHALRAEELRELYSAAIFEVLCGDPGSSAHRDPALLHGPMKWYTPPPSSRCCFTLGGVPGSLRRQSPALLTIVRRHLRGATFCLSPLLMHSFCMQHQLTWCAPLAAIDNTLGGGSGAVTVSNPALLSAPTVWCAAGAIGRRGKWP